ncbi:dTDP-glucose 4,6-dehydratase [Patescibacteria group bacterium]|nr:dTDP-glucose 4,6-dehydratase [Patescibacteria group bacterium]
MKILVTGGAGFIGSNFIRYLLKKYPDYQIVNYDKLTYAGNLDNLKDIADQPNYKFVQGDICDYDKVAENIKDVDVVVNFAADSHVDRSIGHNPGDFIQTDVFGTFTLLEAMKNAKQPLERFIQISTDEVYGDIEAPGYSQESDILNPSSPYSASKAGGDLQVMAARRTFGLPVVITRCTNNYGPYQYPEKLIPLFVTNLLEDEKVPLYDGGTQIRDWLYVDDHCSAIDLVLHKGELGEIYNVGANNDPEITNLEITKQAIKMCDKDESYIEPVEGIRPGHDQRYAVDTAKIKELGWQAEVEFDEGIKRTIQWYKDNKWWWGKIKSGEFKKYYDKQYQK